MSVYYFNGAQIVAPYTIKSNEPIYDVDTVSLSKQRASQGAQRWEISFNTATSDATEADMLVGVVKGINTADTMPMPQLPSVDRLTTCSTGRPIGTTEAGSSTVWTNNDGFIPKGAFVKFSGHSKIYMVTADHSTGVSDMQIYPKLVSRVDNATDTLQIGASVIFTYYRDVSNLRGLTFVDGILSSTGIVDLVEGLV
jgi:hypothetical protein